MLSVQPRDQNERRTLSYVRVGINETKNAATTY